MRGTDRSGTITLGGTAQSLAVANDSRHGLRIQNISAGDLWINTTGANAAVAGTGSFKIASGATWDLTTSGPVSVIGATTGQQFSAVEF